MAELVRIASDELSATISARGAELQSLTDRDGRELMTDANPAYWSGRAPLLFPIVGRLHNDTLRVDGRAYAMQKHGFARKSLFDLIESDTDQALFRLSDTPDTRAQYPFAFELDAEYRVQNATLFQAVTVRNGGKSVLNFSFGYHPAFAWPLPYGGAREAHEMRFEQAETSALRRVTPYGTIDPSTKPSPVEGDTFRLADCLFDDDALVWDSIESRSLTYGASGVPSLQIAFPDTPSLGIWTKPGAAFVCVEPWAGIADPEGYSGEFADKPGIVHLGPGSERIFRMNVTLTI